MNPLQFPNTVGAIADFEGFNTIGSLASLNNNPGNLMYGTFAQQHSAVGEDANGFAIFPNSMAGFSAADQLVSVRANNGFTIADLINKWAPPDAPGNTADSTNNYINFVSKKLGVSADTPISLAESGHGVDDLPGAHGGIAPSADNPGNTRGFDFLPSLSASRIAAFVVGVLLILGAVLLFARNTDTGQYLGATAQGIAEGLAVA